MLPRHLTSLVVLNTKNKDQNLMTNYNFSSKFKQEYSLNNFIFYSIILISFKGLNYGIDFKGTLIGVRSNNIEASSIRDVLKNMDLGDVNVKNLVKLVISLRLSKKEITVINSRN